MDKIISISLFGESPRYLRAIDEIDNEHKKFFPEWRLVFYVDETVPAEYVRKLSKIAEIYFVDKKVDGANGTFWRYKALNLPDAKFVIFRDADSKLTSRDARAVSDWLDSNTMLHIMRDHPFHVYPIMAGMFGLRVDQSVRKCADELRSGKSNYGEDSRVLVKLFYETYEFSRLVHASFYRIEKDCKWFPQKYSWYFVGEVDRASTRKLQNVQKLILRLIRFTSFAIPDFAQRIITKKMIPHGD